MEGTCKQDCHLWKKYREKCPNYIESWWKSNAPTVGPSGHGASVNEVPVLVKDCTPKRTLLMLQEIHDRLVTVQAVNEGTKNMVPLVLGALLKGVMQTKMIVKGDKGNE